MSCQSKDISQMEKEVRLKLIQNIGDVRYEIETKAGSNDIELWLFTPGGPRAIDLDHFELDKLSAFFVNAAKEVEALNASLLP